MTDTQAIPSGWHLSYSHLPGDHLGLTCWDTHTIVIDPRQPLVAQRCTLAHEIEHIRRGPSPPSFESKEELSIELAVARALINLKDLGEVMAESPDLFYVADQLNVDMDTLEARLTGLHPAERAYLQERLDE